MPPRSLNWPGVYIDDNHPETPANSSQTAQRWFRENMPSPPAITPVVETVTDPEPVDQRDEIDIFIAGNNSVDLSPAESIGGQSIADAEQEATLLYASLTEMVGLLAEVVGEVDPNHMLAAELTVSLEEARALLGRCTPRATAPRRPAAATPWGGIARVVEPDQPEQE